MNDKFILVGTRLIVDKMHTCIQLLSLYYYDVDASIGPMRSLSFLTPLLLLWPRVFNMFIKLVAFHQNSRE